MAYDERIIRYVCCLCVPGVWSSMGQVKDLVRVEVSLEGQEKVSALVPTTATVYKHCNWFTEGSHGLNLKRKETGANDTGGILDEMNM